MKIGFEENDSCNREGCIGIIKNHLVENCSCHISPPCSSCTSPRGYCEVCGWDEADDEVPEQKYTGQLYVAPKPKELDSTVVDWRAYSTNTGCTMIKRGVYPPSATIEDVRKVVNGTFGGRFNYFKNGKFEFVAYTD
jgi:hypothetical protein